MTVSKSAMYSSYNAGAGKAPSRLDQMASNHIFKVIFVNQGKVYEYDLENVIRCHEIQAGGSLSGPGIIA